VSSLSWHVFERIDWVGGKYYGWFFTSRSVGFDIRDVLHYTRNVMTEKSEVPRKPFFERLADRVYILLAAIFISMGVMLGMAWWASDLTDYLLGSIAVYLFGTGLALTRVQDFYDQSGSLMTRRDGMVALTGLPAQVWALFWIFSFLVITGLGVFLVFSLAKTGVLNMPSAIITLLGLAAVRLGIYVLINSGRLPDTGLSLPGWAQVLTTIGLLLLFWLVVIGMAGVLGLPY
jgi:hypothetical protein